MASIVFFPITRALPEARVSRWRGHCAELALYAGFYLLYLLLRAPALGGESQALDNASLLINLERSLGLFQEPAIQSWFLANAQPLVVFLNWVYIATYWPVIFAVALALYIFRRPTYRHYRNLIAVHLALALILFVLFPLAPPFKTAYLVDTIQQYGPAFYGSEAMAIFYNTNAAMPSLHFSWTCIFAWLFLKELRGRYRYLGAAYPLLTLAAIVITGNHYFLDAVAGVLLIGVAVLTIRLARKFTSWTISGRARKEVVLSKL